MNTARWCRSLAVLSALASAVFIAAADTSIHAARVFCIEADLDDDVWMGEAIDIVVRGMSWMSFTLTSLIIPVALLAAGLTRSRTRDRLWRPTRAG